MSYNPEKYLALLGPDHHGAEVGDLSQQAKELLNEGMHGLCFSIYEEGQQPGDIIPVSQIESRMQIIKPHTQWVRSFSCIDGNEWVPQVARKMGIKTLVGAWLSDDPELNAREIEGLIRLAQEGFVDIAAVGNEVLYRGDLSVDVLLDYIQQVKKAIPDIPVGYVDAYYEFSQHPDITAACDIILANCYPFWEGCHIDYSLLYMKQMYYQALQAGQGKPVIITETGWPSQGGGVQAARAGFENFLKYFINTQSWSKADHIDIFYFASFDESWKVGAEGDVGAYWGLWDHQGQLKF